MGMDAVAFRQDTNLLKAEGWIPCSEELPPVSQFVLYRTPEYMALGKREQQTWYFSGHRLEPEHRPVLCWQPLN
jgi:hypothetical protein